MGQTHVLQFFEEDVANFLREHRISFSRPESVMQAVNALTRDLATSVAFAVNDVRLQRGNDRFAAYAVINDRDAAIR